jgi:hypothetical protein
LRHFHHLRAVGGIGQPTPAHVAAQGGDEGGLRMPLELGAGRDCRPATTKPQSALQYRTFRFDLPTRPDPTRPTDKKALNGLQGTISEPARSDPCASALLPRPVPKLGLLQSKRQCELQLPPQTRWHRARRGGTESASGRPRSQAPAWGCSSRRLLLRQGISSPATTAPNKPCPHELVSGGVA